MVYFYKGMIYAWNSFTLNKSSSLTLFYILRVVDDLTMLVD